MPSIDVKMTATTGPATWSSWSELTGVVGATPNLKRTLAIALVIGTLFVAMNQLEIILSGDATAIVWFKVALTYITPFCVSNLGILAATHRGGDLHLAEDV
jgi:hypothetical protein